MDPRGRSEELGERESYHKGVSMGRSGSPGLNHIETFEDKQNRLQNHPPKGQKERALYHHLPPLTGQGLTHGVSIPLHFQVARTKDPASLPR